MDAETNDVFRVMDFSVRLELLAEAQARYHDQLLERGFESEQAFVLVRDWSQQSWDWTMRDDVPRLGVGAPLLDVPEPLLPPDPSAARPGEPYLLSQDEIEELPDLREERACGQVLRLDRHAPHDDSEEGEEAA